jgi:hypothetical protein
MRCVADNAPKKCTPPPPLKHTQTHKHATTHLPPKLLNNPSPQKNNSYASINNGVYRCGFATTQEAYDAAFDDLAAALGRVEATLAKQRYVAGDGAALTEGACSAGACVRKRAAAFFSRRTDNLLHTHTN